MVFSIANKADHFFSILSNQKVFRPFVGDFFTHAAQIFGIHQPCIGFLIGLIVNMAFSVHFTFGLHRFDNVITHKNRPSLQVVYFKLIENYENDVPQNAWYIQPENKRCILWVLRFFSGVHSHKLEIPYFFLNFDTILFTHISMIMSPMVPKASTIKSNIRQPLKFGFVIHLV